MKMLMRKEFLNILIIVGDPLHFGTDQDLWLTDPDADSGDPKHKDSTAPDADSEHWYIYNILQRSKVIKEVTKQ